MTNEQWTARAEALEEAAGHLELSWTDDPLEREQGDIVSTRLYSEARKCRQKAARAIKPPAPREKP